MPYHSECKQTREEFYQEKRWAGEDPESARILTETQFGEKEGKMKAGQACSEVDGAEPGGPIGGLLGSLLKMPGGKTVRKKEQGVWQMV